MSDIRLIQLNGYTMPKPVESHAKQWVLNGQNNSFYDYVIARYNGSPTNSAIINSYVDLIYNNGLSNLSKNLTDWTLLNSFLTKNDLRSVIFDFVLFGEFSVQVIKTKDRKDLSGIFHLPVNKIAPNVKNKDNEITGYWFSENWKEIYKKGNEPIFYNAFGTSNDEIEIYKVKGYRAGNDYFGSPEYLAGLPYAEMEEEIANYCINHIKNGLSFGYIINVPNGENLTPEEKDQLERNIKAKLTGSSNAGKFVLSFNVGDKQITVTAIDVNSAHKQWEFLTNESRQQLIVSHRVTSPMLFGIKDNTGLGNNANELEVAEQQLLKRVIKPKQEVITDALEDILFQSGYSLKITLAEQKKIDLLDEIGEDAPDPNEWELYEKKAVLNIETDLHFQLSDVSAGTARPNAKDPQDGELFKSRYRYSGEVTPKTRPFCRKMLQKNKLYRLSDIERMKYEPVNPGWGPEGTDTYDILLYKGGGNCHHYWTRETYRKKSDVNSPLAEQITPAQARKAGEILPTVDKKAYTKPINMPNHGFLPK